MIIIISQMKIIYYAFFYFNLLIMLITTNSVNYWNIYFTNLIAPATRVHWILDIDDRILVARVVTKAFYSG